LCPQNPAKPPRRSRTRLTVSGNRLSYVIRGLAVHECTKKGDPQKKNIIMMIENNYQPPFFSPILTPPLTLYTQLLGR